MQTEIEVKFLAVDHDAIRQKLRAVHATLEHPMRLMRRSIMDFPDKRLGHSTDDAFLRIRDEGDRITATYKQFAPERAIDSAKEIEVVTDDYETTIRLFEKLGLQVLSVQESKRETWRLGECEVVLDEWPWIKPYLEIEGPSQPALKKVAAALGLDWANVVTGSVTAAYRGEFDIPHHMAIGANPRVAFDEPLPEWMRKIQRA